MAQVTRTEHGFRFGAAHVEATASVRRSAAEAGEHTVTTITTAGGVKLEVYVSPTGRSVRVFKSRGGTTGVMKELR